ncbi:MAG: ankyrin repeat domain-containing protein [Akkermansia sp.]|nr:ankyrin repeat domain-containing protein [Akkermansia sp.]
MKTSLMVWWILYTACIPAHATVEITAEMNGKNVEYKLPTGMKISVPEKIFWKVIAEQIEKEQEKSPEGAIRNGNAEKLKELLQAGAELTPDLLILAAVHGQTECMKVLLDSGMSPNAPDDKSVFPLHFCVEYGYAECVKLLLDAGADINMRSPNRLDFTPLMLAAYNNRTECAGLLVEAGADVFLRSENYTAMHWALHQEAWDVFGYLLSVEKIRADKALIQDLFEPIPQNAESVRLLMDAGATTGDAWADAVCYGDEQKLQKLLECGAYKGADNMRQLLRAIQLHDAPIMQYVLQTGADVTHFARDAGWEVTFVLKQGKTEHLQMLIEHGMNVNENCSADMNHSLLIEAVFRGCDEAVELLLKSGADINAQDPYGYTALMFASGKPGKVKLLLSCNPDLSLRNKYGKDVLTHFRYKAIHGDAYIECYRLLQEYMQQK